VKRIISLMAIAIMSCAFMFAQETIKISKIDKTSKGIDFGKKKDGAKDVIVITGKKNKH
jgi:hypothetical protein